MRLIGWVMAAVGVGVLLTDPKFQHVTAQARLATSTGKFAIALIAAGVVLVLVGAARAKSKASGSAKQQQRKPAGGRWQ